MKMKKTKKSANGTSFFDHTVAATAEQLMKVIGKPTFNYNDGVDKVNMEWIMELDNGDVFTIYDWKHYRPIQHDEPISWHIGGRNARVTWDAKTQLVDLLEMAKWC